MKIILLSKNLEPFKEDFENYKKLKNTKLEVDFNFFPKVNQEIVKKLKLYDFIIFDSDTIDEPFYNNLINNNFNNIIFLSQYLNWDKIINVFQNDNIYYLKPLRYDDFNL